MSTGMIIALIVIVAVVVVLAAAVTMRARGRGGGQSLQRRFGPEYQRTVDRHDGDTQAAERELTQRVERHGGLRERSLEPAERERFEEGWNEAQKRFVDSPREAVAEADHLLSEVAGARGFPDGTRYEEQVEALSVHHAAHVEGYRLVHRAAQTRGAEGAGQSTSDTERMRVAMIEAHALFDDLVRANGHTPRTNGHTSDGHDAVREPSGREASGADPSGGDTTTEKRRPALSSAMRKLTPSSDRHDTSGRHQDMEGRTT